MTPALFLPKLYMNMILILTTRLPHAAHARTQFPWNTTFISNATTESDNNFISQHGPHTLQPLIQVTSSEEEMQHAVVEPEGNVSAVDMNGRGYGNITPVQSDDDDRIFYQINKIIGISLGSVAVIGILGNCFGFIVALQPGFRRNHIAPFLLCISLCDSLFLFMAVLNTVWEFISGHPIPGVTSVCNVRRLIVTASLTTSGMALATLSVQRTWGLFWPHKAKQWLTMKVAIGTVLAILLSSYILYIPLLLAYRPTANCEVVEGWNRYASFGYPWSALIAQNIIPDVVLLFTNILLGYGIIKVTRAKTHIHPSGQGQPTACPKGLRMVATLAISHLVLTLPMIALRVYQLNTGVARLYTSGIRIAVLENTFLFLIGLNHSINFLLCVGSSTTYRKTMYTLCKLCRQSCRRYDHAVAPEAAASAPAPVRRQPPHSASVNKAYNGHNQNVQTLSRSIPGH